MLQIRIQCVTHLILAQKFLSTHLQLIPQIYMTYVGPPRRETRRQISLDLNFTKEPDEFQKIEKRRFFHGLCGNCFSLHFKILKNHGGLIHFKMLKNLSGLISFKFSL